jgi:hypothetical protein
MCGAATTSETGSGVNSTRASWLFLGAFLLVANVGSMLFGLNESTPSAEYEIVSRLAVVMAVWYWFLQYSWKHRIGWPLDMGLFLAIAPFIVIPYHVVRVERKRGLLTLAALVGVYLGTYLVAVLLYYLLS